MAAGEGVDWTDGYLGWRSIPRGRSKENARKAKRPARGGRGTGSSESAPGSVGVQEACCDGPLAVDPRLPGGQDVAVRVRGHGDLVLRIKALLAHPDLVP